MASPSICCLHVLENENGEILPLSDKTKQKIILCKNQWIHFDGKEKSISETLDNLLQVGSNVGFHKKCYSRFTDKTRLLKAAKRNEKCGSRDEAVKRSRRSLSQNSSSGIFPNTCIICEKDKFVYANVSRKRNREKLSQCMTFSASNTLLEAAVKKNDEHILTKIRDVDIIAKEAKYHKICYLRYTKFLKNVTQENICNSSQKNSYKIFCATVVEPRIIKTFEVLQMNKLSKNLKEIILKNSPDITDAVTNRQLKRWLQHDYPQLVFVKPKQRNLSELVLNGNISEEGAAVFIDLNKTESTESEDMSLLIDENEIVYEGEANRCIYESALILRQKISESPALDCIWPPVAEDLKPETVQKMIPRLLFNFLAWCVGETDDVEFENFVAVSDNAKSKVFAIAQDIIYLASAGRKQTPKHLSLAMAIRHITGCSKVTDILNSFGHCISHSALLEYDTALAEMQLRSLNSLPAGIECNKFSTLAWDNIDFCEETNTGHGTTHNTNGIIIQQSTQMTWFRGIFLLLSCFSVVLANDHRHQTVTFGMRRLAFSTNQFGIDLYRALEAGPEDHHEGNVALCPFCVGSSLAMILLGAEGDSATALRQALYLSWGLKGGDVHLAYRDLIAHIGLNLSPPPTDNDSVLRISHHLSVQRHFQVIFPYDYMCHRFYNASVHRMDFVAEAELSTRAINDYFAQRTAGKASQMLSRIPSPSTNMLLLSALYFRGTLDMDMGTIQQEGRAFMRAGKARVRYGEHDYLNCTAVEVPFKGGLLSLLALLPREPAGMKLLERRLSAQRLTDILNSLQVDTVHFQMPRIVVGQTQGRNLTRALYELGLIDLFTPGHAHLFGISPFGWLHLTDAAHATYVEMRETEHQESTRQNVVSKTGEETTTPTKILLDRPFLWFVMDNVAGLIIAMGKMAHPEAESSTDA